MCCRSSSSVAGMPGATPCRLRSSLSESSANAHSFEYHVEQRLHHAYAMQRVHDYRVSGKHSPPVRYVTSSPGKVPLRNPMCAWRSNPT